MFNVIRFCFTIIVVASSLARGESTDRPLNVLLITADDMNNDSSGWRGSPVNATPHLDRFAATAHRFVNHHVTVAICQPSRSAIFTGRVPHRNGALGFDPIRTDVPTLVEVLQSKGYYTAIINKVPHLEPKEKFPWDQRLKDSGKNPKALRRDFEQTLAESKGKPFFINVNITDPHRPFPGSEQEEQKKAKGKKKAVVSSPDEPKSYEADDIVVPSFLEDIPLVRKEVAQYYSGVSRFDASFGEVLDVLSKSGFEDRTLVIFLSDHGMSFPFSKATVYRNGTLSPVLLRWPGQPEAKTNETLVSSIDILPTILEIVSLKPLDGVDGRSLLPLIRGESQPNRDFVITHINTVVSKKSFPQRCIRTKDAAYQFHAWPDGKPQFKVEAMSGITFQALAEAAKADPRLQKRVNQYIVGTKESFFDVKSDPDERINLIDDPSRQSEIQRLKKLLLEYMERTDDPLLDEFRKEFETKQKTNA